MPRSTGLCNGCMTGRMQRIHENLLCVRGGKNISSSPLLSSSSSSSSTEEHQNSSNTKTIAKQQQHSNIHCMHKQKIRGNGGQLAILVWAGRICRWGVGGNDRMGLRGMDLRGKRLYRRIRTITRRSGFRCFFLCAVQNFRHSRSAFECDNGF